MRYQKCRDDGQLRVCGFNSVVTKVMDCGEMLEADGEPMKACAQLVSGKVKLRPR
jgi:hypothetical protein